MSKYTEVLRNKNFFLLLISQVISQLGDRLNQMALIGFITLRSPGKTLQLAMLISFTILPVFVIGPLAGAYVDRWDRRKTMYICDFIRGVLVLLIPLYLLDFGRSLLPLYIFVFLIFSIGRFFVPAKLSIVPDLVKEEHLLTANSLIHTTGMIAAAIGFAIGGIVVANLGVKGAFFLDSSSFLISSLLVLSIRFVTDKHIRIVELGREIVATIRKSIFHEIKEAIQYILSQKQMRMVMGTLFLICSAVGAISVVVIVFVQEAMGSLTRDLGFLIMFFSIGLFVGNVIYGHFGRKDNCLRTIFFSLFASGAVLAAFAFTLDKFSYFSSGAVLAVIFGIFSSPIIAATNTLIHDVSLDNMRGKIFSSIEMIIHLPFLIFMFLGSGLSQFESLGRGGFLVIVGVVLSFIGLIGVIQLWFSSRHAIMHKK